MMKYVCLAYIDEKKVAAIPKEEFEAIAAGCAEWKESIKRSGHYLFSVGLHPVRTAATLEKRGDKLLTTDGPFAETKEQLGGLTLIQAKDLNEAIQIAARQPILRFGRLEVRPAIDEC